MRSEKIAAIGEKAAELGVAAATLIQTLNDFQDPSGQSFDTGKQIVGRDSSVAEIVGRIQSAVGIVVEFGKAKRADLVPLQTLNSLEKAINESLGAINSLNRVVTEILRSNGGLQSFNYENFHAQAKNGSNHNLQPQFHALWDSSESFLQRFFGAVHILKPRAAYSFQAAASTLSTTVNQANDNLKEMRASLKTIEASRANLATKDEQASAHLEEINRLKAEATSDRKSVADYLGEVTQQKAAIEAVYEAATALQSDVKAYQTEFDQFQKQLDDRHEAFEDGTKSLNDLIAKFEQQRDGIESLIERSKQMLSSATVSGLAANFSSMMTKLTRELRWARAAFYVGIVFLTLSAIPLLAFVLLPIVAPFVRDFSPEALSIAMQYGPGSVQNGWQYLGQVLARIAILLPAAWFVSFAALRHSSLFRLREHYAYKYSMAVAVEGFKQQAPRYDQEIAALVLEQLAFNPADKLGSSREGKETGAPRIAEFLIGKIREKVEKASTVSEKN